VLRDNNDERRACGGEPAYGTAPADVAKSMAQERSDGNRVIDGLSGLAHHEVGHVLRGSSVLLTDDRFSNK